MNHNIDDLKFVTGHGGKRTNSGRKSVHGGKSVAIRVNEELLPLIEQLKSGQLETVQNQNAAALLADIAELKAKIDELQARNLALVYERDAEHQKTIRMQSKMEYMSRDNKTLKDMYDGLKHAKHDCQALKTTGERCSREAKSTVHWHGMAIHVCVQHQKQLSTT